MRRGALATMLAALLILVVGCGADDGSPAPSSSAPSSTGTAPAATAYVNLGDSYAAGAGVLPVQSDSPFLCQRSAINFAHLVAAQRRLPLTDVSCSGADTADLTTSQYFGIPPQLDALGPQTRLVTLMLGGNDENTFGGAISKCGDAIADSPGVPTGSPCRIVTARS